LCQYTHSAREQFLCSTIDIVGDGLEALQGTERQKMRSLMRR